MKLFNKLKDKEIIFRGASFASKHLVEHPKPATNFVPQWYKDEKLFSHGDNNLLKTINRLKPSHGTYKACVPVTDTITSGYMVPLPATVVVVNTGLPGTYVPFLKWQVEWDVCDTLSEDALQSYPIPHGYNKLCFRWQMDWIVETPKDYSLWVTHPAHRYDLPFHTINGFVDTDTHPNRFLLPFFIQEGFEGIIERGTPIAQLIPVKRDSWLSKTEPFNEEEVWKNRNVLKVEFNRAYKKLFWTKKTYK